MRAGDSNYNDHGRLEVLHRAMADTREMRRVPHAADREGDDSLFRAEEGDRGNHARGAVRAWSTFLRHAVTRAGPRARRSRCISRCAASTCEKEKFEKFAEIPLPKGGAPRTRSFTQEEVGRCGAKRCRDASRFSSCWTSGRPRARERSRRRASGNVDWERRIIDYRQPGVNYKNKRRGEVALSDWVFDTLREMVFEIGPRHPDEYLIGNGTPRAKSQGRDRANVHVPRLLSDPREGGPEGALGRASRGPEDLGHARAGSGRHAPRDQRRHARHGCDAAETLLVPARREDEAAHEPGFAAADAFMKGNV
jgi:hypothetical protein